MGRKPTFLEQLEKHAENELTETKRIAIAKKKFLLDNKEDILTAKTCGYSYALIAEAATVTLLGIGIPTNFNSISKDGTETIKETKFNPGEIKKFCEAE